MESDEVHPLGIKQVLDHNACLLDKHDFYSFKMSVGALIQGKISTYKGVPKKASHI